MCNKPIEELSPELREIARKNEVIILDRLSKIGQKTVGEQVGASETKMSKLKSEKHIEFFAIMLAVMDIKLVDKNDLLCSPEIAEAMRQMLANSFTSTDFLRILFK